MAATIGRSSAPERRRDQGVIALLSAWAVAGLALDGRVHQDGSAESFFTLPHAVIYSGIAAAGAWILWVARSPGADRRRPAGFALTLAGLALLAAGGPLDLIWHAAFGIEAGLDALLSPTHLVLLAGGVLMLSGPLREAWSAGDLRGAQAAPAIASLALVTAVIAFFFQYASPFHSTETFTQAGHDASELGLAAIALTNVLLVTPVVLVAVRFGRVPRGTATAVFGGAALVVAVSGDSAAAGLIVAAIAGGVAADVLAAALRPAAERPRRLRLFAALAPVPLWLAVFAAVALTDGLAWSAELWTGSVLLAAGGGLAIGVVATARLAPAARAGEPVSR